jgi:hypothetical protein
MKKIFDTILPLFRSGQKLINQMVVSRKEVLLFNQLHQLAIFQIYSSIKLNYQCIVHQKKFLKHKFNYIAHNSAE